MRWLGQWRPCDVHVRGIRIRRKWLRLFVSDTGIFTRNILLFEISLEFYNLKIRELEDLGTPETRELRDSESASRLESSKDFLRTRFSSFRCLRASIGDLSSGSQQSACSSVHKVLFHSVLQEVDDRFISTLRSLWRHYEQRWSEFYEESRQVEESRLHKVVNSR